MNTFKLSTGHEIPVLGLGTWLLTGNDCEETILKALDIGYRHIDTAQDYDNEESIGKALKQTSVERQDIFITSKIEGPNLGKNKVPQEMDDILKKLQTDYIDLLLIHQPNEDIPIEETVEAFQKLKEEGKALSLGVSNFSIRHLEDALGADMEISANQVEFHPGFTHDDLKQFCEENNIILEAYSPLGHDEDLKMDEIKEIAAKYGRSEAQIIISWVIQKGIAAIVKARSEEHLKDNFDALEMSLSPEDIRRIDAITPHEAVINSEFEEHNYQAT